MNENMMNSDHKAANNKSRAGFAAMTWNTKKPCWCCGGQGYILKQGATGDYHEPCQECG